MGSLGSSFPRKEGGRAPHQPSLPCLPPGGEGRAREEQRTVGQGCLSSGPLGCASFPPHQLLNTHPPGLPSSSSSSPKDRWGLAGRNVTTVKALSSGNRVWGSQLCPPRPGRSLMSGLVSARLGLKANLSEGRRGLLGLRNA